MVCLWCEDKGLAVELVKALAERTCDDAVRRRALPDLYHCFNCVLAYHQVKERYIVDPIGNLTLLDLEHVRVQDHLRKSIQLQRKIDAERLEKDSIKESHRVFMRLPVIEVLTYPYLCFRKETMDLFTSSLKWMIKGTVVDVLDTNVKYAGLVVLLVSSDEQIQRWAENSIAKLEPFSLPDFHMLKPVIGFVLNILVSDQLRFPVVDDGDSGKTFAITESTLLPYHLAMGLEDHCLLYAYGALFRALQNRVLRMLLVSERYNVILDGLLLHLQENTVSEPCFWSILYVLEILMDKLGQGFWLLLLCEANPSLVFASIAESPFFIQALVSSSSSSSTDGEVIESMRFASCRHPVQVPSVNTGGSSSNGQRESPAKRLFSWMLPFFRSAVNMEAVKTEIIDKILRMHIQIIDSHASTSELYLNAAVHVTEIVSCLVDLRVLGLSKEISTSLAKILVSFACQRDKPNQAVKRLSSASLTKLIRHGYRGKVISATVFFCISAIMDGVSEKADSHLDLFFNAAVQILQSCTSIKTECDDNHLDEPITIADSAVEIKQLQLDQDLAEMAIDIREEAVQEEVASTSAMAAEPPPGSNKGNPLIIEDDELQACNVTSQAAKGYDVQPQVDVVSTGSRSILKSPEVVSSSPSVESNRLYGRASGDGIPAASNNSFASEIGLVRSSHKIKPPDARNLENCMPLDLQPLPCRNLCKSRVQSAVNETIARSVQVADAQTFSSDHDATVAATSPAPNISRNQMSALAVRELTRPLRRERLETQLSHETRKPLTVNGHRPKHLALASLKSVKNYNLSMFQNRLLAWEPTWLLQEDGEVNLDAVAEQVPVSFVCFDSYVNTFFPLLLLETWRQVLRDWKERRPRPTGFKVDLIQSSAASCYVLCTSVAQDDTTSDQDRDRDRDENRDRDRDGDQEYFFEDDFVLLELRDCDKKLTVFGIVDILKRETQCVHNNEKRAVHTLLVKTRMIDSQFERASITCLSSLRAVFHQFNALIGFKNSLLAKDILAPFRTKTYGMARKSSANDARFKSLNASQVQAVTAISDAVRSEFDIPRICLLQGPPGTGKSYTINALVCHLLKEFWKGRSPRDFNIHTRPRILICAPSNAAIDEIVRKLLLNPPMKYAGASDHATKSSECNFGDFNLLRIGAGGQVDGRVASVSLDVILNEKRDGLVVEFDKERADRLLKEMAKVLTDLDGVCAKLKVSEDPEERSLYKIKMAMRPDVQRRYEHLVKTFNRCKEKGRFQEVRQEMETRRLLKADVICATLSEAGSKMMERAFKLIVRIPFKCVIIDEAGQCCEPEALIPLQYAASKLVLVGDPALLPATVLSQQAANCNFGQSLFERIMRSLAKNMSDSSGSFSLVLSEQYRMHEEMCSFPSQRFYARNSCKLQSVSEAAARSLYPYLRRYVLLNVVDGQDVCDRKGGLQNPVERAHVTAICAWLVRLKVNPSAIGVISFCRQHVRLLRQELRASELKDIDVNVVDAFQGCEKEIVLLSCVSGHDGGNIKEFFQRPLLMNVALTRARQTLIILANCNSIVEDVDWKSLVEDARARNLCFDVRTVEESLNSVFLGDWRSLASHQPCLPADSSDRRQSGLQPASVFSRRESAKPGCPPDSAVIVQDKAALVKRPANVSVKLSQVHALNASFRASAKRTLEAPHSSGVSDRGRVNWTSSSKVSSDGSVRSTFTLTPSDNSVSNGASSVKGLDGRPVDRASSLKVSDTNGVHASDSGKPVATGLMVSEKENGQAKCRMEVSETHADVSILDNDEAMLPSAVQESCDHVDTESWSSKLSENSDSRTPSSLEASDKERKCVWQNVVPVAGTSLNASCNDSVRSSSSLDASNEGNDKALSLEKVTVKTPSNLPLPEQLMLEKVVTTPSNLPEHLTFKTRFSSEVADKNIVQADALDLDLMLSGDEAVRGSEIGRVTELKDEVECQKKVDEVPCRDMTQLTASNRTTRENDRASACAHGKLPACGKDVLVENSVPMVVASPRPLVVEPTEALTAGIVRRPPPFTETGASTFSCSAAVPPDVELSISCVRHGAEQMPPAIHPDESQSSRLLRSDYEDISDDDGDDKLARSKSIPTRSELLFEDISDEEIDRGKKMAFGKAAGVVKLKTEAISASSSPVQSNFSPRWTWLGSFSEAGPPARGPSSPTAGSVTEYDSSQNQLLDETQAVGVDSEQAAECCGLASSIMVDSAEAPMVQPPYERENSLQASAAKQGVNEFSSLGSNVSCGSGSLLSSGGNVAPPDSAGNAPGSVLDAPGSARDAPGSDRDAPDSARDAPVCVERAPMKSCNAPVFEGNEPVSAQGRAVDSIELFLTREEETWIENELEQCETSPSKRPARHHKGSYNEEITRESIKSGVVGSCKRHDSTSRTSVSVPRDHASASRKRSGSFDDDRRRSRRKRHRSSDDRSAAKSPTSKRRNLERTRGEKLESSAARKRHATRVSASRTRGRTTSDRDDTTRSPRREMSAGSGRVRSASEPDSQADARRTVTPCKNTHSDARLPSASASLEVARDDASADQSTCQKVASKGPPVLAVHPVSTKESTFPTSCDATARKELESLQGGDVHFEVFADAGSWTAPPASASVSVATSTPSTASTLDPSHSQATEKTSNMVIGALGHSLNAASRDREVGASVGVGSVSREPTRSMQVAPELSSKKEHPGNGPRLDYVTIGLGLLLQDVHRRQDAAGLQILQETIQKLRALEAGKVSSTPLEKETVPSASLRTARIAEEEHGVQHSELNISRQSEVGMAQQPEVGITPMEASPLCSLSKQVITSSSPSLASPAPSRSSSVSSMDTSGFHADYRPCKAAYYKLPHRHHDGTKCLDRCTRIPWTDRKISADIKPFALSKDTVTVNTVSSGSGLEAGVKEVICIDEDDLGGVEERKNAPSDAYYKFPHRHADGLLCVTSCGRLLKREMKRKLLEEQASLKSPAAVQEVVLVPWVLIPLDLPSENPPARFGACNDPRLLSYIKKEPSSPEQAVYGADGVRAITERVAVGTASTCAEESRSATGESSTAANINVSVLNDLVAMIKAGMSKVSGDASLNQPAGIPPVDTSGVLFMATDEPRKPTGSPNDSDVHGRPLATDLSLHCEPVLPTDKHTPPCGREPPLPPLPPPHASPLPPPPPTDDDRDVGADNNGAAGSDSMEICTTPEHAPDHLHLKVGPSENPTCEEPSSALKSQSCSKKAISDLEDRRGRFLSLEATGSDMMELCSSPEPVQALEVKVKAPRDSPVTVRTQSATPTLEESLSLAVTCPVSRHEAASVCHFPFSSQLLPLPLPSVFPGHLTPLFFLQPPICFAIPTQQGSSSSSCATAMPDFSSAPSSKPTTGHLGERTKSLISPEVREVPEWLTSVIDDLAQSFTPKQLHTLSTAVFQQRLIGTGVRPEILFLLRDALPKPCLRPGFCYQAGTLDLEEEEYLLNYITGYFLKISGAAMRAQACDPSLAREDPGTSPRSSPTGPSPGLPESACVPAEQNAASSTRDLNFLRMPSDDVVKENAVELTVGGETEKAILNSDKNQNIFRQGNRLEYQGKAKLDFAPGEVSRQKLSESAKDCGDRLVDVPRNESRKSMRHSNHQWRHDRDEVNDLDIKLSVSSGLKNQRDRGSSYLGTSNPGGIAATLEDMATVGPDFHAAYAQRVDPTHSRDRGRGMAARPGLRLRHGSLHERASRIVQVRYGNAESTYVGRSARYARTVPYDRTGDGGGRSEEGPRRGFGNSENDNRAAIAVVAEAERNDPAALNARKTRSFVRKVSVRSDTRKMSGDSVSAEKSHSRVSVFRRLGNCSENPASGQALETGSLEPSSYSSKPKILPKTVRVDSCSSQLDTSRARLDVRDVKRDDELDGAPYVELDQLGSHELGPSQEVCKERVPVSDPVSYERVYTCHIGRAAKTGYRRSPALRGFSRGPLRGRARGRPNLTWPRGGFKSDDARRHPVSEQTHAGNSPWRRLSEIPLRSGHGQERDSYSLDFATETVRAQINDRLGCRDFEHARPCGQGYVDLGHDRGGAEGGGNFHRDRDSRNFHRPVNEDSAYDDKFTGAHRKREVPSGFFSGGSWEGRRWLRGEGRTRRGYWS